MNWKILSAPSKVKELGRNLKQMRLNANVSQAALAERTGLDRTTISRMENGRAATLDTLVRVLDQLDKLEVLDAFITTAPQSPAMLYKMEQMQRQRASEPRKKYQLPKKPKSEW